MNTPVTFPPFAPKLKLTRRTPDGGVTGSGETRSPFQESATQPAQPASQTAQPEAAADATLSAPRAGSQSSEREFSGPIRLTESADSSAPFCRPGSTGISTAPIQPDVALQNGWDQLKRARALLEAEQMDLRNQRMAVRELEGEVARRELTLRVREQALKEREAAFAAAQSAAQAAARVEEKESPSAVSKLTRAPFDIARSVFGGAAK